MFKLFIRDMPFPTYGWDKTFSSLHPSYEGLNREEIAIRVFSTSNPDDLKTYLVTVLGMYKKYIHKKDGADGYSQRFKELCNTFGLDYDIEKGEVIY